MKNFGIGFGKHIWKAFTLESTLLAYEAYNSRRIAKGQTILTQKQLEELSQQQQLLLESNKDIKEALNVLENNFSDTNKKVEAIDKITKEIEKVISDKGKSLIDLNINELIDKYLNQIYQLIDSYKEFLSVLSIEELCMVINITTSLFILGCVISILFAHSGNYIVDKLKLDVKFPKLATIIKWRVKFQNFYILFNFLALVLSRKLIIL